MFLWNLINRQYSKRLIKSVLIVAITSSFVVATTLISLNINSLIDYFFLILAIKVMFKKNFNRLITEFCLLACVCIILQLIIIFIFNIHSIPELEGNDFYKSLSADITYLLVTICIYRFAPIKKLTIIYKQNSTQIYFFCFNLMIFIVSAKCVWDYSRPLPINTTIIFLAIPAILILGNIALSVYHIKNKELQKSLDDYEKYAPVISQLLEDVRRRQHDFKNHLNTIYGLIQVSDEKNLKETIRQYIHSLNTSLDNIENILHIENTVVTAIIYNKINEALIKNIDFKYFIQYYSLKYPLEDYELSEVLNNLLDNAFEAVSSSEYSEKTVNLTLGNTAEQCIIEISNTGHSIAPENIPRLFNKDFSTKGEKGHGYGLYNVKKIVDFYNGSIQLSFKDGFTVFSIIFSL